MDKEILYQEILSYSIANENDANKIKYSRFFKEGYNGYGLTQLQINEKVKSLSRNTELSLEVIINTAPLLLNSIKYEVTSFLLLLINERDRFYTFDTLENIKSFFKIGINNWAHADTLGMMVLPKFLKKNIVSPDYFNEWISSDYKFQRRSAVVTLIKSIKSTDNINNLFEIIKPLMHDTEREVHQGAGWFLKKSWEAYPVETEIFLMKYKDISPRLIFQIACEKMEKENKLKFRKAK